MKTTILIVSCEKHFDWLKYCLRSVVKFASGFHEIKVMVPDTDISAMSPVLTEFSGYKGIPIHVGTYQDWPGKGFLRHEHMIVCSDEVCPDADFILHIDSDCMFTEPVAPEDYFIDGKPVLMHASFDWLINHQQANLGMWKVAAENAIGGQVTQETMRRHPAVHYSKTYAKTRELIEAHTGKPCADYIASCDNAFPQTFAEFPTLGAVAWRCFPDDYFWRNQQTDGFPPSRLVQFWSHSPPHIPQAPAFRGKPFECTPDYFLK